MDINTHAPEPLVCHVAGCGAGLAGAKSYYQRFRLCQEHLNLPCVMIGDAASRFCQKHLCFHAIGEFDGSKKSCRESLRLHNARRQHQRNMNQGRGYGKAVGPGKAKQAGVRKLHKPHVRRNQVAIELPAETTQSGARADKQCSAPTAQQQEQEQEQQAPALCDTSAGTHSGSSASQQPGASQGSVRTHSQASLTSLSTADRDSRGDGGGSGTLADMPARSAHHLPGRASSCKLPSGSEAAGSPPPAAPTAAQSWQQQAPLPRAARAASMPPAAYGTCGASAGRRGTAGRALSASCQQLAALDALLAELVAPAPEDEHAAGLLQRTGSCPTAFEPVEPEYTQLAAPGTARQHHNTSAASSRLPLPDHPPGAHGSIRRAASLPADPSALAASLGPSSSPWLPDQGPVSHAAPAPGQARALQASYQGQGAGLAAHTAIGTLVPEQAASISASSQPAVQPGHPEANLLSLTGWPAPGQAAAQGAGPPGMAAGLQAGPGDAAGWVQAQQWQLQEHMRSQQGQWLPPLQQGATVTQLQTDLQQMHLLHTTQQQRRQAQQHAGVLPPEMPWLDNGFSSRQPAQQMLQRHYAQHEHSEQQQQQQPSQQPPSTLHDALSPHIIWQEAAGSAAPAAAAAAAAALAPVALPAQLSSEDLLSVLQEDLQLLEQWVDSGKGRGP